MGLSYGQTVTVHTTLLRIDGIEKGQLLIDKTLPIAWEYVFVTTDTLDWTTVSVDSLQYENTEMKNDILVLQEQIALLQEQLLGKLEYGDVILLGTPETNLHEN
jgi:hypothetical protein